MGIDLQIASLTLKQTNEVKKYLLGFYSHLHTFHILTVYGS